MKYVRRYCYCCETYKELKVSDKAYYKLKAYGLTFGTFNSKVYTICEECWSKIVGGKEDE